jgi:Family of unknown function (DUF5681)
MELPARGLGLPQNNMDSVAVSCYRDLEMDNAPPKANRGRFKKGQSGNPGGRPKMPPDMKAAIQEKTPELLKSLFALARQKADPRVQAVAIKELLDRGWGRAAQTVNAKIETVDVSLAHLDALKGLVSERANGIADEDDPPEVTH